MSKSKPKTGLVVLAGAGPGAPDLAAPATLSWLSRADVVICDRLVDPALLAFCREQAEVIYAGKEPTHQGLTQEQISELLVKHARAGKVVVRLKGGDPLIFARGGEEAQALRAAAVPYRVVPGITAATAAGAYAGIPLTDRRYASTVAFVTGHEDPAKEASAINWAALAAVDTLVFYMGVGNLPGIADRLIQAGRDRTTPAAIVERAACPNQRTITATLGTLAEQARQAGAVPPAVIIVGQVVSLRRQLAWLEELPLFGKTVLVTRPRRQAPPLALQLGRFGAHVIEAPTVSIEPPAASDIGPLDSALRRLGEFDWVVFTSPNGVDALVKRMGVLGLDGRALARAKIAAIGPATRAALENHFLSADLVPEQFTTEALGKALCGQGASDRRRVLLVRSDIADPKLAEMLAAAGTQVEEVAGYRTVAPVALPDEAAAVLQAGQVDWITFTSTSTVTNFLALAGQGVDLSGIGLAVIGPVTAEALRAAGLEPTVIADPHTIEALVEAMVEAQSPKD